MRTKFVIFMSIFLLLGSFMLACGMDDSESTTLAAAEGTATTTYLDWSGINQTVELEQKAHDESVRNYLQAVHDEKLRLAAERAAQRAAELHIQRERASRAAAARSEAQSAPQAVSEPVGNLCGGDLPPCWVLKRENRNGDPRLWNGGCYAPAGHTGPGPCGSTASGIWQITRGTWGSKLVKGAWVPGFGGYMNAADAPVEVQLQKARALWAGGKGCSHWSAC